jgi:hypothetical protein
MVTASTINRISRAIDEIEKKSQPRPWKVVQIYCGYDEDMDFAQARHYAAHPEDRGADVVIRLFSDPKETANDSGK